MMTETMTVMKQDTPFNTQGTWDGKREKQNFNLKLSNAILEVQK